MSDLSKIARRVTRGLTDLLSPWDPPAVTSQPTRAAAPVAAGTARVRVRFALDGVRYEVDLAPERAQALRAEIATWAQHGRRISRSRAAAPAVSVPENPGSVRAWARDNGYEVSDRGRLPTGVVTAYRAAH